jgi:RND superfamily putative drug exporter
MLLTRVSSWCFQRRRSTVILWIVALVLVNVVAGSKGPDYSNSFTLPGTESQEALDLLKEQDPDRAGDTAEIVFQAEQGVDDPAVQDQMEALFEDVTEVDHVVGVLSPYAESEGGGGAQQVSEDGTIAFARVQFDEDGGSLPKEDIQDLADRVDAVAADAPDGVAIATGGFVVQAIEQPPTDGLAEIIGLIGAVIILLLAFRSIIAMGLPIAVAIFGIGIGLAVLTLLTYVVSTPEFAPFIASMIGIGVGIDYALFIVTRHREGLRSGLDPAGAARHAMRTAGRAVMFAGLTVVISMLGLLLMGFEFIYGVAVGAALVVLVVMLGSITLLPALLGFSGTNIDRWGLKPLKADAEGGKTTLSYRWSRVMQHHAVVAAVLSLGFLLLLAAPVLSIRLGVSDAGNNPEELGSRQAYDLLSEGFGPGFNGPFLLATAIEGEDDLATLGALSDQLNETDGVAQASPPVPNEDLTSAVIYLNPDSAPQDEQTTELVHRLRDDIIPEATEGTDLDVNVGGITPIFTDFTDQVQARLPLFFAVVIGLSFLLLMVVFRSVLVPLKAAIMNLLSIGAAYGVIVAIFQWGWFGDQVGIGREGPIESWVPIMLFAILFGLSMDYEVFLLSRIREEYNKTGNNEEAVANGLASTARVITAAAAIMITVFLVFALSGDIRALKLFAIGLAVAILVDATIVRLILVPSTMELLGSANWWLPRWLDRILPDVHIEAVDDELPLDPPSEPGEGSGGDDAPEREPVGVG